MKTFDEAFAIVTDLNQNPSPEFQQDLLSAAEFRKNEAFRSMIMTYMGNLLVTLADSSVDDSAGVVCNYLHTAFAMGLRTGMEMEKQNIKL